MIVKLSRSVIQLSPWIQETFCRFLSELQATRQRSIRKSIWKEKKPQPHKGEKLITQLSNIGIGDDYTVGIASIDSHHRIIALMFNSLVTEFSIANSHTIDMKSVFHRISTLITAISDYFISEEREMINQNNPRIRLHKKQHDEFLVDIMMLMDSIKDEDYGIEEFLFFVGSWWSGHVLISDKNFAEFLGTPNPGAIPPIETPPRRA